MEFCARDNLGVFVFLLVPGFISIKVYELITASDRRNWAESLFETAAYGCIDFAVLYWAFDALDSSVFLLHRPFARYLTWILIVFVAPAIWPVLLHRALDSIWLRSHVLNQTPTAWDHFFSGRKQCWALIHLRNGAMIGGFMGEGTFTSSYPKDRDIYLTEVWKITDEGSFDERMAQTLGMWIGKESIDYVEFFRVEGGEANGQ